MENTEVIFIYGAPASGKLTTAKKLAQKLGYRLLHNHLTTDLVRAVFDRGNDRGGMLIVKFRFEMLEAAVQEKVKGLVMTGAYAQDYVYPNGKTDEWFVKELERITVDNGGVFYGVNLSANKETLLHRVKEDDRKEWGKITDEKILAATLDRHDFSKTAPLKNNIIIENDTMPADQVVEKIMSFIS